MSFTQRIQALSLSRVDYSNHFHNENFDAKKFAGRKYPKEVVVELAIVLLVATATSVLFPKRGDIQSWTTLLHECRPYMKEITRVIS